MKWRTPQPGDVEVSRVFLWTPRDCEDGQARWLEWVTRRSILDFRGLRHEYWPLSEDAT